jgi:hypothetical protein
MVDEALAHSVGRGRGVLMVGMVGNSKVLGELVGDREASDHVGRAVIVLDIGVIKVDEVE